MILFYTINLSSQSIADSTYISPRKLKLINDPLTPSKAAFYSSVIPGLGQVYKTILDGTNNLRWIRCICILL